MVDFAEPSVTQKQTRVVVVDDHPWIRLGLAGMFRQHSEFAICGEAEDAQGALEVIGRENPDLAIVDISLKGDVDGIALTNAIKHQYPHVVVLVLSMHIEADYARRAMDAGASGYLIKSEAPDMIFPVIRGCMEGRQYLSHEVRSRMGT